MKDATRPSFTHFGDQTRCNRCDAWMGKGKHHSHDCPPKAEEVTEDHIEALESALGVSQARGNAPEWSTLPPGQREYHANRARALIAAIAALRSLQWQPIATAPKCDLHPYDKRASAESQYVLVWNGHHIGCAYYQIDDDDPKGGDWIAEDGPYIDPEPTHWLSLPSAPEAK